MLLHNTILVTALALASIEAFAPTPVTTSSTRALRQQQASVQGTSTRLHAIPALAKKAKEAALRQYISEGIPEEVMTKYNIIKEALKKDDDDVESSNEMGPIQEMLTKRKGTITVVAEYKRKLKFADADISMPESFDPEILSPQFREFGASAIAVMADERMGGCTYEDLQEFVTEQNRSKMEVPGPVPIINNDLIIDELQIARTAVVGAKAVTLSLSTLGSVDEVKRLMKAAKAVDLECIISVTDNEQAKTALRECGARMILITGLYDLDEMANVLDGMEEELENQERRVTVIGNILAKTKQGLGEIETAWACRDKGFHSVWVCEALYKGGNSLEHPGSIIKGMKSKSSLKWASPKAAGGKGEGAREYLGDILM